MLEHYADLANAALLGGLLFFPSVVAPSVFTALPEEQAGVFLRSMFPKYYVFLIIGSVVCAALYAPSNPMGGGVCIVIALSTLWVRQSLVPRINRYREDQLQGDALAGTRFNRLHRLSVVINMVQIVALLGLLFT